MKLTRRQLAAAVCATAVAPAQTGQSAAPSDDLQTARDRLKANAEALQQHELPAATEPAFKFQA
jgi:hypothetical protein